MNSVSNQVVATKPGAGIWGLVFVLAVAAGLAAYHYLGYYASDDNTYLAAIKTIASGGVYSIRPSGDNFGTLRWVIIMPLVLLRSLGAGWAVIISYNLIYYFANILLLWFFLREFYRGGALIGSLIFASSSQAYLYAGSILPDNLMTFFLGLCFVFMVLACFRASGRRRLVLFFLSGISIGLAYGTKETGIIAVVPAGLSVCVYFGLGFWKKRDFWLAGSSMAFGLLVVLLIEVQLLNALFNLTYGDGLMGRLFDLKKWEWLYNRKMELQGFLPTERITYAFQALRTYGAELLVAGFVIGPLGCLLSRRHAEGVKIGCMALIFFVFLFLYLTIGTTSFSSYNPPTIQARYFLPCVLFFAVGGACLFDQIRARLKSPFAYSAIVSACCLILILYPLNSTTACAGIQYRSDLVKALRMALKDPAVKEGVKVVIARKTGDRMWPVLDGLGGSNYYFAEQLWQLIREGDTRAVYLFPNPAVKGMYPEDLKLMRLLKGAKKRCYRPRRIGINFSWDKGLVIKPRTYRGYCLYEFMIRDSRVVAVD